MLNKIFNLGKEFAGITGIPTIVSRATSYKKTIILFYHNPTPRQFESHVKWLTKYYVPISMELFLQSIVENKPSPLPPYSVVISFDDGWKENALLLPIIVKYRLPVIIYLTADIVGTYRKFWWLPVIERGDDPNRLKELSYEEMANTLKNKYDYQFEREYNQRSALTWKEINELKLTGYVEFGSHSLTHPILTQCSDEMAFKEISDSKKKLEHKLDQEITHFSYPNGNFSHREKKILASEGYRTGRSTTAGLNDIESNIDLFEIKTLYGSDSAFNSHQLSYIMSGLDLLRKRITLNSII